MLETMGCFRYLFLFLTTSHISVFSNFKKNSKDVLYFLYMLVEYAIIKHA